MKRPKALKGNDRIALMKLFLAFFYESITKHYGPTDGPTDRRTDTRSYRDARTHLKSLREDGDGDWGGPQEF